MFFYGYSLWLKLNRKRHFSLYLFIRHCLSEFSCHHSQWLPVLSAAASIASAFLQPKATTKLAEEDEEAATKNSDQENMAKVL